MQVGFEQGCAQGHGQHPADEERQHELERTDRPGDALDGEQHDAERDQEAPEQDEGGHQVGVARRRRDDDRDDPEGEAGEERLPPPTVMVMGVRHRGGLRRERSGGIGRRRGGHQVLFSSGAVLRTYAASPRPATGRRYPSPARRSRVTSATARAHRARAGEPMGHHEDKSTIDERLTGVHDPAGPRMAC